MFVNSSLSAARRFNSLIVLLIHHPDGIRVVRVRDPITGESNRPSYFWTNPYVLRHMPQAVRSSEAALAQVAPSLEEAARSLGRRPVPAFVAVTLPLVLPGLFAGGALVFLSSLKELPATLLLRPAGFDTLSVRFWITASEGVYTQAAPAALLLIACAAAPLYFLLRREIKT